MLIYVLLEFLFKLSGSKVSKIKKTACPRCHCSSHLSVTNKLCKYNPKNIQVKIFITLINKIIIIVYLIINCLYISETN